VGARPPRDHGRNDWKPYLFGGIGLVVVVIVVAVFVSGSGRPSGQFSRNRKPPRRSPPRSGPGVNHPAATKKSALPSISPRGSGGGLASEGVEKINEVQEDLNELLKLTRDMRYPGHLPARETAERIAGFSKYFSSVEAGMGEVGLSADDVKAVRGMLGACRRLYLAELESHAAKLAGKPEPHGPEGMRKIVREADTACLEAAKSKALDRMVKKGVYKKSFLTMVTYSRKLLTQLGSAASPGTSALAARTSPEPRSVADTVKPTKPPEPEASESDMPEAFSFGVLPSVTPDSETVSGDGNGFEDPPTPEPLPPEPVAFERIKSEEEGVVCWFTFTNMSPQQQTVGSIEVRFTDVEDNRICYNMNVYRAEGFTPRWSNILSSPGTAVTAESLTLAAGGQIGSAGGAKTPKAQQAVRAYITVRMSGGQSFYGQGGKGLLTREDILR